jgi:subtilisin family serine protease
MPNGPQAPADNRILVKLRPSDGLRAAESRANLRPLYDTPRVPAGGFGLTASQWYVAELPDGAATPWDLAHARVADQLGVAASDVEFAEPDLVHNAFEDPDDEQTAKVGAIGQSCGPIDQDAGHKKAVGPEFAWHLRDDFSQLGKARGAVTFGSPRTRIAHLDTGYYPHETRPENLLTALQRNFADGADDANLRGPSSHGTGTMSVLAGGKVSAFQNAVLGGAPGAEVLPVRVADGVVLLRTSALARGFDYAVRQACDVVTLSLGGLPTRVWAEAVDDAYEAGVCICAAAGNHIGFLPPRTVVYPARFRRVIAVCGIMANQRPYVGLSGLRTIEGSFGPESAMKAAIAAYTPNVPWAVANCEKLVRRNGEGTSAATPQVAAAVALWFEKNKASLPRDWRRVEAVRNALFSKARKVDPKHFGNGVLQAHAALQVKPVLVGLPKSEESKTSLSFLRLVSGIGIDAPPPREEMFNVELAQLWMTNDALQKLVPDPGAAAVLEGARLRRYMEAVIEDPNASLTLRRHVAGRYPVVAGVRRRPPAVAAVVPEVTPVCTSQPAVRNPPYRRVRVFALDPSLSVRLETADISEVTLKVRWEGFAGPGPVGEYLAVDDVDAAGQTNQPVDLDDPRLLAQDGWAPAEGNPQFHQQMVYAVAMKTIEHFEKALGRPVLWRPRPRPGRPSDDSTFVRRLAVRPHALHQANAFYSPQEVALLFGYFEAGADDPGDHVPGSRVYTCLSHDVVAHETTHAILDGMHRRFNEPTNLDVLAFHEAFADVVALLQHFTIPELLEAEIARTRGDVEAESMLGQLAVQLGRAIGGRGGLRSAIGKFEDGVWKRSLPDPAELQKRVTPHARGALLVAAVFDAFIAIYKARIADLLRLYTGGTGVLPTGAIHPDLVRRLADEAAKSASHVLNMCIRALDYLPPVDLTFFEYLRALITADFDLVSDDRHNYRVAFAEAFRRRGIYPLGLDDPTSDSPRTLSVDTLRWQGIEESGLSARVKAEVVRQYAEVIEGLKGYANACFYLADRERLFAATRDHRRTLHGQLRDALKTVPRFAAVLGIDSTRSFEVHELRHAMRIGPDGRHVPQLVVALTQTLRVAEPGTPPYLFRSGATLIVDLSVPTVKYTIVKNFRSAERRARTADFVRQVAADPLRGLLFGPDRSEPFAALHALADEEL